MQQSNRLAQSSKREKPVLCFYTNMPTPYQLDFFDALKAIFDLTVIYFTEKENDRLWSLKTEGKGYKTIVLKNGMLAKKIQRFFPSFHYSRDIKKIAGQIAADLVIVNGTYWSLNVMLALRYSKRNYKQVAYWSEPVFPTGNPVIKMIKSFFLNGIRKNSTLLLAIGKKAEESYRAYKYPHAIYNIPYNINATLFERQHLNENTLREIREKYKSRNEVILLTSGSLVHRKGIDTVIKAFQKASSSKPMRLLIIGDGPEKATLQELAAGNEHIHFLGFQEKDMVPYWFNLADIFVFASRYDGWALVINEALAAGNAVVCSKAVGAAYDCLVHGSNALLCEPEATEQYVEAISSLVNDAALLNKIQLNAKNTGMGLASDQIAKKLYDIYRLGQ